MSDEMKGALRRSDGCSYFIGSWFCFIVGLLSLLLSAVARSPSDEGMHSFMLLLGMALVGLWIPLLIAGSIIRAIYFLPGDQLKLAADDLRRAK